MIEVNGACGGRGLCRVTAIIAQIPYDISESISTLRRLALSVLRNGSQVSASLQFSPYAINVHLLTQGKLVSVRQPGDTTPAIVARHANGEWVTPRSPAKPGESLDIWATGLTFLLDRGSPVPPSGRAAGPGYRTQVWLRQDFGQNLPAQALTADPIPLSAELEPDQVGVFKISVKVPEAVPANLIPCGGPVQSNYTVTIGYPPTRGLVGASEFEGARLCVEPSR